MRKVLYFHSGTVADFAIPDDRYEEFSKHVKWDLRYSEGELDKARKILGRFVTAGGENAGPGEIAAACFVWQFFNTTTEDAKYIKGDIVIVDLSGDGSTIEYVAADEIQIAPDD